MKIFPWFRPRGDYGKETSADHGLLTAAEPRSIEQVVDEYSAELKGFSPEDLRWWELSQKIRVLKHWREKPRHPVN
jgi:hypothetical protein